MCDSNLLIASYSRFELKFGFGMPRSSARGRSDQVLI